MDSDGKKDGEQQMNTYICDKCGKVILPAENACFVTFLSKGTIWSTSNTADLCSDCFQHVKKIAFGKVKTESEGK